MPTLILDSGGSQVSVVLAHDTDRFVSRSTLGRPLAIMHSAINEVLEEYSLSIGNVERVAVVLGPGMWTGLQVALATAKTLCYIGGKALVPLSRLDAIAQSVPGHDGRMLALLAASREKFIVGEYQSGRGATAPVGTPRRCGAIELAALLSEAKPGLLLAGEFDDRLLRKLAELGARPSALVPLEGPTPEALVRLAFAEDAVPVTGAALLDVEPIYMQDVGDFPAVFEREKS